MGQTIYVSRDSDIRSAISKALRRVQRNDRARTIDEGWAYQQVAAAMSSQKECALYISGGNISYMRANKHSRPKSTKLVVVILNDMVILKAWRKPHEERRARGLSVIYLTVDEGLSLIDKKLADKWIRSKLTHLVLPPRTLVEMQMVTKNAAVVVDNRDSWYLATRYGWGRICILWTKDEIVEEVSIQLGIPIELAERIVDGDIDPPELEMELALAKMAK